MPVISTQTACSQSEANSKAQAAYDAYDKQSYANSHGTCSCSGHWTYETEAVHSVSDVVSDLQFDITFKWVGACTAVNTGATITVMKGGSPDLGEHDVSIPSSWASGHTYTVRAVASSPDYGYRFGVAVNFNGPTNTTCNPPIGT